VETKTKHTRERVTIMEVVKTAGEERVMNWVDPYQKRCTLTLV
jgi:hypothetical protein